MEKELAIFNWSTGKDSAMALYLSLKQEKYEIRRLLTTLNMEYGRVSQHGVREELLDRQAGALGLPLEKIWIPGQVDMDTYSELMKKQWRKLKQESTGTALFGDIHLEHLRKYREAQLASVSIRAEFPLWKKNTHTLAVQFIELGFKAIVVCVDSNHLDKSFAGRRFGRDFLRDLPAGVDPCGENGEFHTFVFDGPIFSRPVTWKKGRIVYRKLPEEKDTEEENLCVTNQNKHNHGMWFCDIL